MKDWETAEAMRGFGLATEYEDGTEMFVGMLEQLLKSGEEVEPTEGGCLELRAWVGRLKKADLALPLSPRRNLKATYAGAEMAWYASGTPIANSIAYYAPQYPRWCEPAPQITGGGCFAMHGALGSRLMQGNPGFEREASESLAGDDAAARGQLQAAIRLLQQRPNTRQCFVALWDSGDLAHAVPKDRKNLPCYVGFHFTQRNGHLDLMAIMRSNDAWLGAPYDIYAFTSIQRIVAAALGLRLGSYTHVAGSLHLYRKHENQAREAIRSCWVEGRREPSRYGEFVPAGDADPCEWATREMDKLSKLEARVRCGGWKIARQVIEELSVIPATPTNDWVICAAAFVGLKEGKVTEVRAVLKSLGDPRLSYLLDKEIRQFENNISGEEA
jgi:thymidylate synthase